MNPDYLLRFLERVHGHLGWLAVAALLHPALLLRNPRRRATTSILLTTLFVTLAGGLGAWIYPDYRTQLKLRIFVTAPEIGWMFERKEHLAVGVICFCWIGCLAHFSVPWFPDPHRETVARLAHRSFLLAFGMGVAVGIIGVLVATYASF